ncbi:MAG TPA: hypothetical protein VGG29_11190 [Caulobacteraceae bacterium]|jgi:hypothetical protein
MALLEPHFEAQQQPDGAPAPGRAPARPRKPPGEAQLRALERLQEVVDVIDDRARAQVGELPPSIIEPAQIEVASAGRSGRFLARQQLRSVAGVFLYCAPQRRFYVGRPGPEPQFTPVSEEKLVEIYDEWLADWTVDFLNHLELTVLKETRRREEDERERRQNQGMELLSALTLPFVSVGAVLMTPIGWVLAALFGAFAAYHFLFLLRLI